MKKVIITFLLILSNISLINYTNAFSLDFEEVNYNYKSWNNESTSQWDNWYRTTSQHYNGSYALQSGIEEDGKTSCFEVREYFHSSGWIQFNHKESSENNYDKLKFYINGTEKNNWSGITGWQNAYYSVNSGWNYFKWCYVKDGSLESGDDRVRVDNIRFQSVWCNTPWRNDKDWRQTYSCSMWRNRGAPRNVNLYNATLTLNYGFGVDLENYYIKFWENPDTGTSRIPSKITIPSDYKIDDSTGSQHYESYSYDEDTGMTSCPAGMYALKIDRSDYQGSSATNVGTSGTLYCGN